ncbi:S-layer homology domain-containing protein [Paenibacillus agri]|uniref:S-layer homology domain-containing protein n=1 Tax=Paenibacillus agri TaxID=2744309 RepID=A0A850ES92_9BACL|nr:S-layer homology domain-containing protein [Paenibacillus agri]NUU64063.1 S-layer homology domain-containing protein [Paenibacillus agri]
MMNKKIAMLGAAAILTLTITGQSFAAGVAFTDLANIPAKDKIISLQQKGYIQGVSSDRFDPKGTLTAAQGIQLLVNAFDLNIDLLRFIKEPHATDYFPKANDAAWYANTLIIAANNNIDLSKDLDPGAAWTKEEFTHHLILAMGTSSILQMIKIKPMEFGDQGQLSTAFDGSVQLALVLGIAKLDQNNNFKPQEKITRAEAAELVYNALAYIEEHPAPAQGS